MPDKIESLLHRRGDLGTFLVHLTRNQGDRDAPERLISILREGILASGAYGMATAAAKKLDDSDRSQRVVCFTETPLEHMWMMTREIEGRRFSFAPYGVVFTKTIGRRKGCNPVWYLDMATQRDWLTKAVDALVLEAKARSKVAGVVDADLLRTEPIFRLTPFIEQMGTPGSTRKEFWWEREWRHVGDFSFRPRQAVAVLAPEHIHDALRDEISEISTAWKKRDIPILDPEWGLERMIGALARMDEDDLHPFPI